MKQILCVSLCLLSYLLVYTNAWILPPSVPSKNSNKAHRKILSSSDYHHPKPLSPSSKTRLNLKFLEKSEDNDEIRIQLSPDEDDAVRSASKILSDEYGVGFFDVPEAWEKSKVMYPILDKYSNNDLRQAYLEQKPKIIELLTDTPLGPFLAINLLFKFTGFTWCDTPFHQDGACPPF